MKGVIWSCDRNGDGIDKLKYIIDRYEWSGIPALGITLSRNNAWAEFANGDVWRVAGASDNSRGIRSNIAWIDSRISQEMLETVVLRTLVSFNGPRYYEFYNAKE